jgi:uncharacterized glyoxalase superfamily protein PhnB
MTSIAPWLSMKNATEALAYYKAAFGAIELERLEDEAGDVVIAQLSIEGADFWDSDRRLIESRRAQRSVRSHHPYG